MQQACELAFKLTSCMCGCSYAEEANADKAIKALTAALAPQARVMRDGRLQARLCSFLGSIVASIKINA